MHNPADFLEIVLMKKSADRHNPLFPDSFPDPADAVQAIRLVVPEHKWVDFFREVLSRETDCIDGADMPLPINGDPYQPQARHKPISVYSIIGAVARIAGI